jgi:hypothetical protein
MRAIRQNEVISTPKGNIHNRIQNSIWRALKSNKGGKTWESLVGYNLKELMAHLEKHFLPAMSWENMGLWHIDHKIPVVVFNFKTAEDLDFRKCWALKNLQPLWKFDNLSKHAKLSKPFQPSLLMAVNQ